MKLVFIDLLEYMIVKNYLILKTEHNTYVLYILNVAMFHLNPLSKFSAMNGL